MVSEMNELQRGINHSIFNQRFLRNLGEESIRSLGKHIKDISQELKIPEEIVVRKIRSINPKNLITLDDLTREIYNALLKVEDTWNIIEDYSKEKQKRMGNKKPNQTFLNGNKIIIPS